MIASWDSLMLTWVTCGICITSDVILISLLSPLSHFYCVPLFKKVQQGSNIGGTSSCSMVQLQIAPAAESVRSLSSRKSRPHHWSDLLQSWLSFNLTDLLAKGAKQTSGQVTRWWLTNFFLELVRQSKERRRAAAQNMVTAPRAESNCCKSECTAAARARGGGAQGVCSAPRATCFLRTPGRPIPTSLHQRLWDIRESKQVQVLGQWIKYCATNHPFEEI